jgi:dihydrodipicolinate synthase/N-acetylneuraminate lyase
MAKTYAAALTPLYDDGHRLDEDAFAPYADFLHRGAVDGILALGTTGEGILFDTGERMRAAELFLDSPLDVIVHCGAQTTIATIELAEHAAERDAAGVAVIAPPYFQLDERALLEHFAAAANACHPVPFYVYEFARASGYAVPLAVIERLRERVHNLVGMKVSDSPWERLEPYLLDGLDVFVGAEALLERALVAGAAGAVSGLAASFPDAVVALVREPTPEPGERVVALRADLQRFPFHAASKAALGFRGVPVGPEVRAPLRGLTEDERVEVERIVVAWG